MLVFSKVGSASKGRVELLGYIEKKRVTCHWVENQWKMSHANAQKKKGAGTPSPFIFYGEVTWTHKKRGWATPSPFYIFTVKSRERTKKERAGTPPLFIFYGEVTWTHQKEGGGYTLPFLFFTVESRERTKKGGWVPLPLFFFQRSKNETIFVNIFYLWN